MFEIYTITGVNTSGVDFNEEGRYDYITRTSLNRGIHSHIDEVEGKIIQPEGTYSLGLLGMDFFYRDEEWFAGQFVRGVRYKDVSKSHNHLISLYLEVLISKYKEVMKSYLVKNIDELFRGIEIELPILTPEDTTPYWDYMAYYIHNIQQQYADQLEAKTEYELDLMCQILGVTRDDINQRVEFTQPQYINIFTVGELFEVKSTKKAINKNTITDFNGKYPYVTRKEGDNGIDSYINEDEQYLNPGNTISLAMDTYVLYYQQTPYFTGNSVKIVNYKGINKENALYIITALNKTLGEMTWGETMNMARLNKIELELPVIAPNSKQIDWGEIRNDSILGGINYLATRMEVSNRDLAIIRQLIQ